MDDSGRDEVSTSSDSDSEDDGDLLGGLESLLEEEGVSLEEEDAFSEDDLGDIFSDGGQEGDDEDGPTAAAPIGRNAGAGTTKPLRISMRRFASPQWVFRSLTTSWKQPFRESLRKARLKKYQPY